MDGRSGNGKLSGRRRPRGIVGRAGRRLGLVLVLALLVGAAAPTGDLAPKDDPTPVSWLWDWFSARPSWAFRDPPTPVQPVGRSTPGHYVKTPRVLDTGRAVKAEGELAAYEPHRLEAGTRTAGADTKGFDPRTSQRIASAATERSDVYRNADGSYTRRVYPRPVNYKAADGTWRPIDSRLRLGDGRLRVTANSVGLSFAGSGAAADLVRVTVRPGVELAYTFSGAAITRPAVDREVARYRDALSNMDLELGARADGVTETLVLRSADVPTQYVHPLRMTGLTPRIAGDGSAEFVDAGGAVAVSMPVGYLEDSAVDASGGGATSHDVTYEVVTVDGAPALRISIDEAWLRDPARMFPVRFHSSATVGTKVDAAADSMPVGTWNSGGEKSRALVRFADFDTTFAGQRMTAAGVNLFMSYQGNGTSCVARPYTVHPVEADGPREAPIGGAAPSSDSACDNDAGARDVGIRGERRQLHDVRCGCSGCHRRSGAVHQSRLQQPGPAGEQRLRPGLVVHPGHAGHRGSRRE